MQQCKGTARQHHTAHVVWEINHSHMLRPINDGYGGRTACAGLNLSTAEQHAPQLSTTATLFTSVSVFSCKFSRGLLEASDL